MDTRSETPHRDTQEQVEDESAPMEQMIELEQVEDESVGSQPTAKIGELDMGAVGIAPGMEVEPKEDRDDHISVANEPPPASGSMQASTVAAIHGLEMVAGYDARLLDMDRETLSGQVADERLLDAWYADLADPVAAALLRAHPDLQKNVAEVVIGTDDRVRISPATALPWRWICSLRITAADGSAWIGTGWLVGPRTLITAGHVVYIHSRGGWVRSIEVIPGRDGDSRPFGACTATSFRSVKGWTNKKKRSHDYGAVILPSDCRLGSEVGFFGFANLSQFSLLGLNVNLSGYPGDKPAGTQWWHARRVKWVTSRTLVYNIDTAGGQSGSPVWRLTDGKRHAVGIHTNGSSAGNSATRIAAPVFDNIKKWKAEGM
ncbi:MAG TPA: serine protease [Nitriliruptorales bacterium]|nr:serine protease [Nitriliruptorales bacterium]